MVHNILSSKYIQKGALRLKIKTGSLGGTFMMIFVFEGNILDPGFSLL